MPVEIRRLTKPEFLMLVPTLVDIYMEAMEYSPAIRQQRIRVWRGEVAWPGFTAVAAVYDGAVVGVAYGFLGARERWWDRQLVKALRQNGGLTTQHTTMLADYFEVAEVHVSPAYQGKGIGTHLLRELLRGVPARWALLSTPEVDGEANNAFSLYRKFGFEDLVRHFHYDGDARPFAILALDVVAQKMDTAGGDDLRDAGQ